MEPTVAISPQKYFFDNNDFDEEALRRKREALRRPTFSQEEMEASRQTGFAQGREEGQRETMASLEARLAELMQQISQTAAIFMDNEAQRLATFIDQSTLITTQILIKVLPVLLKALSLQQIESFVSETLRAHVKKGGLTIFVAPEFETAIRQRIHVLSAETPHQTNWQIKIDPNLQQYQSRIEWSGGGADWNPEVVANAALESLINHLPEYFRSHITDGQTPQEPLQQTAQDASVAMDEPVQTDHTDDGEKS